MGTVARNFNVGLELHETGLNVLSARLLKEHPNWFTQKSLIPIDPASPHRRFLVLEVSVTNPVSFNFSPVVGSPTLTNQVVARVAIHFQLSDLQCDGEPVPKCDAEPVPITGIRAVLQAIASVKAENELVSLFLEQFQVLHLEPDQPDNAPVLSEGALDFRPALEAHAAAGVPADDAFTAILNYLIAVFLEERLKEPIAGFPVPQMQKLPLMDLPVALRGLRIFSDRLGFYTRHEYGPLESVLGAAPTPLIPEPHVSIGVVAESIRKLLIKMLPLTIPLEYGDSSAFFQVLQGSSITVLDSTSLKLQAPNVIRVLVRFRGRVNMRINITLGKYHLQLPVDLPIGEPSYFSANWNAFTRVDQQQMVHILLRPSRGFMDGSEIVVLTEWRKILKAAALDWLRQNVSPVLLKIPWIGWVVAKTVEVVASELAEVFGTVLDGLEGGFLSLMGTLLFQVLRTWFNDQLEFDVYQFSERLPVPDIDLRIASIAPVQVVDNQGGELVLRCSLDDQGVVVPEPPVPELPAHPELPPTPGSPTLPTYPAGSFAPVLAISELAWRDGMVLTYDAVEGDGVVHTERMIQFARLAGPDRWEVSTTQTDIGGTLLFTSRTNFEAPGMRPLSENSWGKDAQGRFTVTSSLAFDVMAHAVDITVQVNAFPALKGTLLLPDGARLVSTEEWILELMSGQLNPGDNGKLARVDIQPGTEASNWVRVLPMQVAVAGVESINWRGGKVACLKVQVTDEQLVATLWIEVTATRRVLVCDQRWQGGRLRLTLQG